MSELKGVYNKESIGQLNEQILILEQSIEDTTWAQADAYLKAKQLFGLKEFAKVTHRGSKLGTMKVYANVAESYPSVNRFTTVSFKHHMVAMNNDSRYEWLKKAQDNAWSAERLRREMNPPKQKEPVPEHKIEPNPVAEVKPAIVFESKPKNSDAHTFEEIVGALNYYYYKEQDVYQMFGDLTILLQKLFWEERRVVFADNQFKIEELDGSFSEHMSGVYDR